MGLTLPPLVTSQGHVQPLSQGRWKHFAIGTLWLPWWLRWERNSSAMQETWVWSLSWEGPLEDGMANHSSILAWRIPWTEEPGGLQSVGSPRVRHDWATKHSTHSLEGPPHSPGSPWRLARAPFYFSRMLGQKKKKMPNLRQIHSPCPQITQTIFSFRINSTEIPQGSSPKSTIDSILKLFWQKTALDLPF